VVVGVGSGMLTACGGGDTPAPDQRNCIGRIPESPPPEQIFEGYHIILACGLGSKRELKALHLIWSTIRILRTTMRVYSSWDISTGLQLVLVLMLPVI
jgi:hypothetical protein